MKEKNGDIESISMCCRSADHPGPVLVLQRRGLAQTEGVDHDLLARCVDFNLLLHRGQYDEVNMSVQLPTTKISGFHLIIGSVLEEC